MSLRDRLKKASEKARARARAKIFLMMDGKEPLDLKIFNIPEEREVFPGTKDHWQRVRFPSHANVDACIYEAVEGSQFPFHLHSDSVEYLCLLNEGAEIQVITEDYVKNFKYPATVIFPKG